MKIGKILAVVACLAASPSAHAQTVLSEALACGGKLNENTIVVNRDEAKCRWPFDVQTMQIKCIGYAPKMGAVFFTSEKGAFALNGKAKQKFTDPRPIWLDADQAGMGKIDVSPWIQVGLVLC